MLRTTTVLVAVLSVLAPMAMAQQQAPKVQPQPLIEEAMVPARDVRPGISPHGFILDELGNVYDRDGQLIRPKPLRQ
jgi:hypothetical protein